MGIQPGIGISQAVVGKMFPHSHNSRAGRTNLLLRSFKIQLIFRYDLHTVSEPGVLDDCAVM